MENKEIMERLLQDDKPSISTEQNGWSVVKANKWDVSISRIRVVTAKYKVYIVLLLIFIALLLVIYIPEAQNSYESIRSTYEQADSKLNNLEMSIQTAKNDMEYLCDDNSWIINNEEALKKCLNEWNGCSKLPESRKKWTWDNANYDFSIPLSYLQLHSLYNKKMPVDEKVVLKNLNEYLIKQNISWWDKGKVWDILRIDIGNPNAVKEWDNHFFQVPVDVKIEFWTISDLTGFLYNVEKKLINKWEDRILYKIKSVSYDIISSDEPQITDISMIAFYYHDDQFNNTKECSEPSDDEENNNLDDNLDNDSQEVDESDSDSFFKNLFKDIKG